MLSAVIRSGRSRAAAPLVDDRATRVRPPRSSRTRGQLSSIPLRLRRIGTELSHDVLNPARVPL